METTRNKRRTLSSLTMRKWWPCVRWRCPFFFRSRDLSLSFPSSPGCVRAHLIFFSFLSFFQSPITIDTISFRGSGPLIDGQRSRNFRPRWPSFECDLPACPTCRHARWAPGASSAPRPRRCRPCKSTSPGWPLVQGCGEQRLDRLCPLTHQLELSKEKKENYGNEMRFEDEISIWEKRTEFFSVQRTDTSAEKTFEESFFGRLGHFTRHEHLAH